MPELYHKANKLEKSGEGPRLCRSNGRALIDAPVKPERRASRRWLAVALSLGALVAAPDAAAKSPDGKSRSELRAAAESERAVTQAAIQRLERALTAARSEQATNEHILEDVSAERVELALTVIEQLPIEQFVHDLAMMSGLPVSQVAQDAKLERLGIYTPSYLASKYEPKLHELEASGDPVKTKQAEDLRAEYQDQADLAGFELNETTALVNVDSIDQNAGTDDAKFQRKIYRAATHEFIHTLVDEESILQLTGANLNDAWIEEGLVDLLAERLTQRYPLYGEEKANSGYVEGPLPAAWLLNDALGEESITRHLLQEDWTGLGSAFDTKFGTGAWERVRTTTMPLSIDDGANQLVPVYGMLREMGTERATTLERINTLHPDVRLVPLINETGEYQGVVVREAEVGWKVTNGIVVKPIQQVGPDHRLVMSVNAAEIGTPRAEAKADNWYYAAVAPEYENRSPSTTSDEYVTERILSRTKSSADFIGL